MTSLTRPSTCTWRTYLTISTSNRLLGLLGLKTSSKSLSRLRAMAKSQSDIPPVPPIPKDVFRPGS